MFKTSASPDSWLTLSVPSLEHPFGIHLWPIFEKAFLVVKGHRPQDFRFVPGQTLMSTHTEVALVLGAYYVIILGGREIMRTREPFQLSTLFKIHNFYLTAISGVLLALFLEQLIPTLAKNGLLFTVCSHKGGWTDKMVVLYYLNYLTKYLEFIDTFFLFLKKKPLTFLHTYHHGATALLCYTQLLGQTPVSWVPITLNLMVHVVMYWYYFQSARGIRIWWKKYITILQIIQFIIDIGFIYFATYTHYTFHYFPWLPNKGDCGGEGYAAASGVCIISSYLFLFLGFYVATYNKPVKKGRGRASSALAEMKDETVPTIGEARRRFSGSGSAFQASGSEKPLQRVTRSRKA